MSRRSQSHRREKLPAGATPQAAAASSASGGTAIRTADRLFPQRSPSSGAKWFLLTAILFEILWLVYLLVLITL
jgi:hypothetical protein